MPVTCTRCDNTGFLNIDQVDDQGTLLQFDEYGDHSCIKEWIGDNPDSDVQVCDCCGDGEDWYGVPGEHYNDDDPEGLNGPYAYNGGLCECD